MKRGQVLPKFPPPPSRPSRISLQCPPHPIAMVHHLAIAMPRRGGRRSCDLDLAITARFNAMMIAKLVYAAICAARITTKGSWVIEYPGNSAYRPLNLLSPSKNIREPSRRLFRTSFCLLYLAMMRMAHQIIWCPSAKALLWSWPM